MHTKRFLHISKCAFFSLLILQAAHGSNLIWGAIGPAWPIDLLKSEKPTSWHAELGYGRVFGEMIGVGVEADFLWNQLGKDSSTGTNGNIEIKLDENNRYLFPLAFFLSVDPIPQYRVHPVIKGTYGVGLMVQSKADYVYNSTSVDPVRDRSRLSGFYYGVAASLGADAVVSLEESVGFFAGMEYQWIRLRKNVKKTINQYYRPGRDGWGMSGVSLRAGFRFTF